MRAALGNWGGFLIKVPTPPKQLAKLFNDNAFLQSTFQNSGRLTFGAFAVVGFDPNVRGRYQFDLSSDFGQDVKTVTAFAQLGAVPEPATWAMMIIGFGFVGYAMRRRRTGMRTVNA